MNNEPHILSFGSYFLVIKEIFPKVFSDFNTILTAPYSIQIKLLYHLSGNSYDFPCIS